MGKASVESSARESERRRIAEGHLERAQAFLALACAEYANLNPGYGDISLARARINLARARENLLMVQFDIGLPPSPVIGPDANNILSGAALP